MENVDLAWSWDLGREKHETDRANRQVRLENFDDSKAGLKGWDGGSQEPRLAFRGMYPSRAGETGLARQRDGAGGRKEATAGGESTGDRCRRYWQVRTHDVQKCPGGQGGGTGEAAPWRHAERSRGTAAITSMGWVVRGWRLYFPVKSRAGGVEETATEMQRVENI